MGQSLIMSASSAISVMWLPSATLAGNVRLGERVLVGAGANILPGINIGDAAIIGAGAVVTADVPPGTTYVGVPARQIR